MRAQQRGYPIPAGKSLIYSLYCAVHCPLYTTVQCRLYTIVHCPLYTIIRCPSVSTAHCPLYTTVHCRLYTTVHCPPCFYCFVPSILLFIVPHVSTVHCPLCFYRTFNFFPMLFPSPLLTTYLSIPSLRVPIDTCFRLYLTAFMSSKRGAGFNHKQYGVTSEGVVVYLDVALRAALGIDPRTQPFTVKITGGPDGDVAGKQ